MKKNDRIIVLGLLVAGLAAAFWFLVISPKRAEVSKLDDQIEELEASVAAQEQLVAVAEQSQAGYDRNYHRLVVLGKAVPGDDDAASLVEQTQVLADRAGVDFRGIVRSDAEAAAAAPGASETTADTAPASGEAAATPPESGTAETTTPPAAAPAGSATAATTAPAAPTEAAAALLPIGATVGPAGLPVLPYDLTFQGDFFEVADFLAELDGMVRSSAKGIGIDGRLLTVDGFALKGSQAKGFPSLDAALHVTTYVVPADQGVTAGATAAAPAATVPEAAPQTTAPATAPTTGPAVP